VPPAKPARAAAPDARDPDVLIGLDGRSTRKLIPKSLGRKSRIVPRHDGARPYSPASIKPGAFKIREVVMTTKQNLQTIDSSSARPALISRTAARTNTVTAS
jgi:hypothetical protein